MQLFTFFILVFKFQFFLYIIAAKYAVNELLPINHVLLFAIFIHMVKHEMVDSIAVWFPKWWPRKIRNMNFRASPGSPQGGMGALMNSEHWVSSAAQWPEASAQNNFFWSSWIICLPGMGVLCPKQASFSGPTRENAMAGDTWCLYPQWGNSNPNLQDLP